MHLTAAEAWQNGIDHTHWRKHVLVSIPALVWAGRVVVGFKAKLSAQYSLMALSMHDVLTATEPS